jgi:hypothetical protein
MLVVLSAMPFRRLDLLSAPVTDVGLVMSQLEYCSTIWKPWQNTFAQKIERVETKLLNIYEN